MPTEPIRDKCSTGILLLPMTTGPIILKDCRGQDRMVDEFYIYILLCYIMSFPPKTVPSYTVKHDLKGTSI